eukprot:5138016-Amphidinium_carterae.1
MHDCHCLQDPLGLRRRRDGKPPSASDSICPSFHVAPNDNMLNYRLDLTLYQPCLTASQLLPSAVRQRSDHKSLTVPKVFKAIEERGCNN